MEKSAHINKLESSVVTIQRKWRSHRVNNLKKEATRDALMAVSNSYRSLINASTESSASPNNDEKSFMTLLNSSETFEVSADLLNIVKVSQSQK